MAFRLRQAVAQPVFEERYIRQTGQRVVESEMPRFPLLNLQG
jgi:hypothetical protein